MQVHLFAAVLTAVFAQRAREAQMKILARRPSMTVRAVAVMRIDPAAVAVAAEKIGLRHHRCVLSSREFLVTLLHARVMRA